MMTFEERLNRNLALLNLQKKRKAQREEDRAADRAKKYFEDQNAIQKSTARHLIEAHGVQFGFLSSLNPDIKTYMLYGQHLRVYRMF